jgi:predicted nucleic acid-binding protein
LHIASAVELNCKYFITTDRQLIKKLSNIWNVRSNESGWFY